MSSGALLTHQASCPRVIGTSRENVSPSSRTLQGPRAGRPRRATLPRMNENVKEALVDLTEAIAHIAEGEPGLASIAARQAADLLEREFKLHDPERARLIAGGWVQDPANPNVFEKDGVRQDITVVAEDSGSE